MDWSKLNMNEVSYYCKSNEIDFDCFPFDAQIEQIVLIFYHYGIHHFTVKDVQEFYQKMQIPKIRSEGIVKPIPSRIRGVAERMENIKCMEDGSFEIIPSDMGLYVPFKTYIYTNAIEKGYQNHRIERNITDTIDKQK